MSKFNETTIQTFISELSSNTPVPGGGAVAALSGALAGALGEMVVGLSVGKKFYEEYDNNLKEKLCNISDKCTQEKSNFLHDMDKDVEAFDLVLNAFKLPKETDEDKRERTSAIQSAYMAAMMVPLDVAKRALQLLENIKTVIIYGNPNCLSDAGVGAIQAFAAVEGAILNVKINLKGIKDEFLVKEKGKEANEIIEQAKKLKSEIDIIVNEKMA